MAVHRHLLARPIRDLELRRVFPVEIGAEELEEVDEFAISELGKRGQLVATSQPDQLDATIRRLPEIIKQIRVSLEERT